MANVTTLSSPSECEHCGGRVTPESDSELSSRLPSPRRPGPLAERSRLAGRSRARAFVREATRRVSRLLPRPGSDSPGVSGTGTRPWGLGTKLTRHGLSETRKRAVGLRASGSRGGLVSGRVAVLVRSSIPLAGRGTVPDPGALALTSFGTRASHPAKAGPGTRAFGGICLRK